MTATVLAYVLGSSSSEEDLDERAGRPVIPAAGAVVDDEVVGALGDADQR